MGAGKFQQDQGTKVVFLGRFGEAKVPVGYVADGQGLQVLLEGHVLVWAQLSVRTRDVLEADQLRIGKARSFRGELGVAEAEGERGRKESQAGEASTSRGARGKHVQPRRKSLEEEVTGSSRVAGNDLVELSTNVACRTSMISGVLWAEEAKWN